MSRHPYDFKPSLLENGFNSRRLYKLAIKEANSKRPLYQIHKWWARRLGSVFRVLAISSFLKDGESMQQLWHRYYNGTSLRGKILADPMMGGGTSIVEGLRLGCKVIGLDINPVAWFITKKEIEPFDNELAEYYFRKLENTVGREILQYYQTKCPRGHKADVLYVIWAQQTCCKNCKSSITLLHDHVILENHKLKVLICPKCLNLMNTKSASMKINCKFCNYRFGIREGVLSKGTFRCSDCNTKDTVLDAVKRYGKPLPHTMLCIEYHCNLCGRGHKIPTPLDLALYNKALKEFSKEARTLPYPQGIIVVRARNDKRPISHGYNYFHQLFNTRQLLCLSKLLKEILKIKDDNMQEFFLLAFSSCLETNNKFCKYESKWDKISAIFSIPGYHPIERYGENNVWGSNYGRGTFVKCFQKLKRGKQFGRNTFERIYRGETMVKKQISETIAPRLASSYNELKHKDALLLCQNSMKLNTVPDKVVDIILTDPPYFDNLVYSELADFFYVWLRLGLKKNYAWFKTPSSQNNNEIIIANAKTDSVDIFVESLTQVFKECHRILKDNGIMVFTFHHTKPWAWDGLKKAIVSSRFVVTAAPVIRSEGRTGYRKGSNISYDVCVVCRKKKNQKLAMDNSVDSLMRNSIKKIRELYSVDPKIKDTDILTAIMSEYLRERNMSSCMKLIDNWEHVIETIKDKAIKKM